MSTSPCQVSEHTAKPYWDQPGSTQPPELQTSVQGAGRAAGSLSRRVQASHGIPHHCLSFPLSLSLPDPGQWLLHDVQGPATMQGGDSAGYTWLRQDPACHAPSRAALGAHRSHQLLSLGTGGPRTPQPPPVQSCTLHRGAPSTPGNRKCMATSAALCFSTAHEPFPGCSQGGEGSLTSPNSPSAAKGVPSPHCSGGWMDGWMDSEAVAQHTSLHPAVKHIHTFTLAALRAVFPPLEREETEAGKAGDGSWAGRMVTEQGGSPVLVL